MVQFCNVPIRWSICHDYSGRALSAWYATNQTRVFQSNDDNAWIGNGFWCNHACVCWTSKLAKNKFLTYLNIGYVEIVRAIPLLVLILWIYYGLPIMTGISFSPFVSGIIALSISESAFQAEIFRAGINSIKKSQWEAGSSLGLNFFRKLKLVILPQAIKNILPAIGNQFVYVLKMSSLVSIIGIGDLTRKANELVVTTYRPLEIYTFLILEYLILILIVSYLVRKLEKKLQKD